MKVYVLREEDLWSTSEMCEEYCPNTWSVIGVFTEKAKAQKIIDDWEKEKKKHSFGRYFDIEEFELDEYIGRTY